MSINTRVSAPVHSYSEAEFRSQCLAWNESPSKYHRTDAAHPDGSATRPETSWTICVTPALTISQGQLPSPDLSAAHSHILSTDRASQPARPMQGVPHVRFAPVGLRLAGNAVVRQRTRRVRFYPAQWQRAAQPTIDRLLRADGQQLQWVGWDRSLPRLYLSADQLTRVVLDLLSMILRNTGDNRSRSQPMSMRVSWQTGGAQALVLDFDHPGLAPSKEMMPPAGRAPFIQNDTNAMDRQGQAELARIATLARELGGSLMVSLGQASGTLFRLSLPVDDRVSLVQSWLAQLDESLSSVSSAPDQRQTAPATSRQIHLFAIGRKSAERRAALAAVDARLHGLAASSSSKNTSSMVYRVANSRWLWLTTASQLPEELQSAAWQSHLIDRWYHATGIDSSSALQAAARLSVARAIAARMDLAIGIRVPPTDSLKLVPTRSHRLRIDRVAQRPAPRAVAGQTSEMLGAQHTARSAASQARQRRWRYPI